MLLEASNAVMKPLEWIFVKSSVPIAEFTTSDTQVHCKYRRRFYHPDSWGHWYSWVYLHCLFRDLFCQWSYMSRRCWHDWSFSFKAGLVIYHTTYFYSDADSLPRTWHAHNKVDPECWLWLRHACWRGQYLKGVIRQPSNLTAYRECARRRRLLCSSPRH